MFRNNTTLPLLKTNVEGDTVHRYSGWPMFDSAGKYLGPLPSPRRSQTSLVRSERDESFRTGSTATYPAELCKFLAELLCRDFLVRRRLPASISLGKKQQALSEGVYRPTVSSSIILDTTPLRAAPQTEPGPAATNEAAAPCKELIVMSEAWRASGPPPRGAGWWGVGKPIEIEKGSRRRPIRDGAGLCSPGRWPKAARTLPDVTALRNQILALLRSEYFFEEDTKDGVKVHRGQEGLKKMIFAMACGKVVSSPFSEDIVILGGKMLEAWCMSRGCCCRTEAGDRKQVINVRRLQAFLLACKDPDAMSLDSFAQGVRVGAGMTMPRTPAVYEEKVKWRLKEVIDDEADWVNVWRDNYSSAIDNAERLKIEVEEEVKAGRMIMMTKTAALEKYQNRLAVASLALIQEGPEKWRMVHDGTNGVLMNNRIRTRDQSDSPTVSDLKAITEEMSEEKTKARTSFLSMTWDFEKAHRRVEVDERDWGLQACAVLPGEDVEKDVYLNTCGTYGIGSASYYWGRIGAMATRAQHYFLGHEYASWILLYADDGKISANIERFAVTIPLALLLLVILGFPVKWKKCHGGTEYQWIGYWENVRLFTVGISEARRRWAIDWMRKILTLQGVSVAEFRAGLGRLGFVCSAIVYDKPFLGPLYTWVEACAGGTFREVPVFIKFVLTWLIRRLECRKEILCDRGRPRHTRPVELFRSDAKAEGDTVRLGGWQVADEAGRPVDPIDAWWYVLTLDRVCAPWAYRRGEPFRTIASLELFGTLISAMIFLPRFPKGAGALGKISVGGSTDNRGNTFAVTKLMTTKFPLVAFVAEMAVQMEEGAWDLELEWVPRDQNIEADAITNQDFSAFTASREIKVDCATLKFKVLNEMLALGDTFYEERESAKEAAKLRAKMPMLPGTRVGKATVARGRKAKKVGLKETQPW